MSAVPSAGTGKVTVPSILERKSGISTNNSSPAKITCLTAYDYPTARLLDEAGVDVLLVGDSVGMAVLGYDSTLPVTMEDMLHHTRAVRPGTRRAVLGGGLPQGSFHEDPPQAVGHGFGFVKEAGAGAHKVEGGERRLEMIARLVDAEIPVMGHIGLTPQSVNAFGGFRVQGKTAEAGEQILRDAHAVEAAAHFPFVLESIPRSLRHASQPSFCIPTIGIGGGAGLRRTDPSDPRFTRNELRPPAEIRAALRRSGRNHLSRGRRILPRRAAGNFSFRQRVISCAHRKSQRACGTTQISTKPKI